MVLSKDNKFQMYILHVIGYLYLKVVLLQPVWSIALQNFHDTFTKITDDKQILT